MDFTSPEAIPLDLNPPGSDSSIPKPNSLTTSSESAISSSPESASPIPTQSLPQTDETTPTAEESPSPAQWRKKILPVGMMVGPMKSRDRMLRAELDSRGVKESRMPSFLKDDTVFKSKKGKLGMIKVNKMSGVQASKATSAMRIFEANVGGKDDVELKLLAVRDQLSPEMQTLLGLLGSRPKASLARLVAEAGADPVQVMKFYAEGAVYLGQVQAAIQAHSRLPDLVKDLYRHALDQFNLCKNCVGSGTVARPGQIQESVVCPDCMGQGGAMVTSKYKSGAMKNLLEMTKQIGQGGGVNVQVNTQTNVSTGGGVGFMEKMLDLADSIIHKDRAPKQDIVEAEIVSPEGS